MTNPIDDPAQAEWERTAALDAGISQEELDAVTASGLDPDEFSPDDQIPASDLPSQAVQPETQGADPTLADIGEDGQGDISPQDL